MVLNTLSMGKLRTLLATAAGGLALAGCEAGATDQKTAETAEFTKLAAVVETADDIKKRCRALSHETEAQKTVKKACYAELSAMRKAEIAAKTAQREENAETIATNEEANEQRRTRNKGLIKQIAEKAAQEDPSR